MIPASAPLAMPTVHLNGTSRKDLEDGYYAALQAVGAAQEALRKIEFNPRDYYPQGPAAWAQADAEMTERKMKLAAVYSELEAVLMHLGE